MQRYAIGVDIGGTKVAIGLVGENGEVQAERTIGTKLDIPPEQMTDQICQTVQEMVDESGLKLEHCAGIGIGAPGPLDPGSGKITCPPNLPSWAGFAIVERFKQHFQLPIRLENDASAAALAEKWVGAAQENDNFIYITISTGIGAGIYTAGKLFTGSSGNAGDVGHFVIDPSTGQCTCGQKGCFEYLASGTAIARRASELLGRSVTTKEVFELYQAKHLQITAFVEATFEYIGMGCVTLINIFDPEKVVIGGGVSQVGAPLFDAVRSYVERFALNPSGRKTKIVPARLHKNVGLIGAAALILRG